MSIASKAIQTVRHEGVTRLSGKAMLYLLRRISWRTDEWSRRLDYSIYTDPIYKENRELLSRNEIFRDRHKGKRAFVIGNGPSLKNQDLSLLKGELTFVTNAFYRHPVVQTWQPSYYFITDPILFEDTEGVAEFYAELREKIHTTTFFMPHAARRVIREKALLPEEQTYYVALGGDLKDGLKGRPDLSRIVPGVWVVTQLAVMAAMYMGCTNIYLLGHDHDWLSHRGVHFSFHGAPILESDEENVLSIDAWEYSHLMRNVLMMWRGYASLYREAQAEGVQIINATGGGFLDVFERADYKEIVGNEGA
jgi:hypothetical protein